MALITHHHALSREGEGEGSYVGLLPDLGRGEGGGHRKSVVVVVEVGTQGVDSEEEEEEQEDLERRRRGCIILYDIFVRRGWGRVGHLVGMVVVVVVIDLTEFPRFGVFEGLGGKAEIGASVLERDEERGGGGVDPGAGMVEPPGLDADVKARRGARTREERGLMLLAEGGSVLLQNLKCVAGGRYAAFLPPGRWRIMKMTRMKMTTMTPMTSVTPMTTGTTNLLYQLMSLSHSTGACLVHHRHQHQQQDQHRSRRRHL